MSLTVTLNLDDKLSKGLDNTNNKLKETGKTVESTGSKFHDFNKKVEGLANTSLAPLIGGMNSVKAAAAPLAGALGTVSLAAAPLTAIIAAIGAAVVAAKGITELQNYFDDTQDALSGATAASGATREELDKLAKQMQTASDFALSYKDALQLVTKGTQAGVVGISDMSKIVAHANVLAKSTGQDAKQVAQQMTEAISKGAAEQLLSMGLLEGGLDGVRAAYDKTSKDGVGSFDKLTETQKKLAISQAALKNIDDLAPIYEKTGVAGADGMDEINLSMQELLNSLAELVNAAGFKEFVSLVASGVSLMAKGITSVVQGVQVFIETWKEAYRSAQESISGILEALGVVSEGTTDAIKKQNDEARNAVAIAQEASDKQNAEIKRLKEAKKDQVEADIKWEKEGKEAALKAQDEIKKAKESADEAKKKSDKDVSDAKEQAKKHEEKLQKELQVFQRRSIDFEKELMDAQKKRSDQAKKNYDEELAKLEKLKGIENDRVKNTRSFLQKGAKGGSAAPSAASMGVSSSNTSMGQGTPPTDEGQPQPKRNSFAEGLAGFGVFNMGGEFGGAGFNPMAQAGGQEEPQNLIDQMMNGLKKSDVLKSLALTNNISTKEAGKQLRQGKLTNEDYLNAQFKALRDKIDKDSGNIRLTDSRVGKDRDVLMALGKSQGFGGSKKDLDAIRTNLSWNSYSDEEIQKAYESVHKPKLNNRQATALKEELKDRQTAALDEMQGSADYKQVGKYVSGTAREASKDNESEAVDKQQKIADNSKQTADLQQKLYEQESKNLEVMQKAVTNINDALANIIEKQRIFGQFIDKMGGPSAAKLKAEASRF